MWFFYAAVGQAEERWPGCLPVCVRSVRWKFDGLMLTVIADALSLGHWAVLGVVTGFTTVLNRISNGSGCQSGKLT